jgi:exodeoxyribonuclease-3
MKVASFNDNSIRARLKIVLEWLKKESPDVLCLQEEFREKLDWLERLCYYFKEYFNHDKPLIWVGDFNVAPESIDVYDPEFLLGQVGFHSDEHAYLQRIKDWGFIDIFRLHHPEPEQYTFWDNRVKNAVKRRIGWHIDYIWATNP